MESMCYEDTLDHTIIKTIYDTCSFKQCFGSGSVWIRIIWSDPDPYQETIDMDPGSVKN